MSAGRNARLRRERRARRDAGRQAGEQDVTTAREQYRRNLQEHHEGRGERLVRVVAVPGRADHVRVVDDLTDAELLDYTGPPGEPFQARMVSAMLARGESWKAVGAIDAEVAAVYEPGADPELREIALRIAAGRAADALEAVTA